MAPLLGNSTRRSGFCLGYEIQSEMDNNNTYFLINYDIINRKPELLLTHSHVEKRAKRTPDITVKTTERKTKLEIF